MSVGILSLLVNTQDNRIYFGFMEVLICDGLLPLLLGSWRSNVLCMVEACGRGKLLDNTHDAHSKGKGGRWDPPPILS